MIRAMQHSASDTMLRALIMGAVLGGIVWAVAQYTTIPRLLLQRAITWYDTGGGELAAALPSTQPAKYSEPVAAAGAPRLFPGHPADARPINDTAPAGPSPPGAVAPAATAVWSDRAAAGPVSPAVRFAAPTGDQRGFGSAAPMDRREQIERRLQALGAVYTLLEMWGRDQRRYRFHCQVAFAGGANATRSFEANGASPLQAMERVLQKVEAWRTHASFTAQPAVR